MNDTIEKIGQSLIQYGPYNGRVYLMKFGRPDYPGLIHELEEIGQRVGAEKIFAKVGAFARDGFLENGYVLEASAPGFFNGSEDALFFAKFLKPERSKEKDPNLIAKVIAAAAAKSGTKGDVQLPPEFICRPATKDDADGMVTVYKEIFETYPFPIHDPEYLCKTMDENFVYFVIEHQGKIVAVASCEMDEENSNVEMTDFASLLDYQGRGFATCLLEHMGIAMRQRGILTGYTIARATSFGMNITFAKHGYEFGGTLVNNTNIAGAVESMNVWHKPL